MKREGDSMSLVITEKRPRHELITIDNGSKQLLAPVCCSLFLYK